MHNVPHAATEYHPTPAEAAELAAFVHGFDPDAPFPDEAPEADDGFDYDPEEEAWWAEELRRLEGGWWGRELRQLDQAGRLP